MELQYQQMNDMQQEFLIRCMDQMLQVRNSTADDLPRTSSSSDPDSAMKTFAHKTQQAMRMFSSSSNAFLPSLHKETTSNSHKESPSTSLKPSKDTKRPQSVAHTTDSKSSDTQSPQSKRHDMKDTPPPHKNTYPKVSTNSVTTPLKNHQNPDPRPSTSLGYPDFGIDHTMEEALANIPSPMLTQKQQQEYINPKAIPSATDDQVLQPTRLSLEKANIPND